MDNYICKNDNAKGNIKLLEDYKASLKKYPNLEHKEKWIALPLLFT